MLKVYLRKAPTLIVIGLTGYVAWPIVFAGAEKGPPKGAPRPSLTAKPANPVELDSMRDPYQVARTPALLAGATSAPATPPKSEPAVKDLPSMAQDEDKVLAGMRLRGTFIDDREKLAVIDDKVYTRGDQLRGADGSLLPYVVTDVLKDRALVRRGRRNFVIAFSDTLRTAAPRAIAPVIATQSEPIAKTGAGTGAISAAKARVPGAKGQAPSSPGDQKEMLLQLLSGLGGATPGGPGTGGLNSDAAAAGVNANSISAGLDALMGKYDNIGRGNDAALLPNQAGGTEP